MRKWLLQKLILSLGSKEKHEVLTFAVKRLYNTIGAEDILREDVSGQWLLEGKVMSEATKKLLVSETIQFEQSALWKILQKDVRYQANRKMFLLGRSEIDLISGKLWLYNLDAMKTRIESICKGKGNFNNTGKA